MRRSNRLFLALMMMFCSVSILEAQNLNRQFFPDMELKNQRRLIEVPDIDGYITLKGDFHMHTIFSDGSVWPVTRVEEAWADGLDVIAITDHDTYHPNKEFLVSDNNTHFKIALESRSAVALTVPDQIPSIEIEITNWHVGLKENLIWEINLDQ